MTTKTATIFLDGGLRLTADLETAVRFALRTGLSCRSEDQVHVAGPCLLSPYARIVRGMMGAEAAASDRDVQAMRLAMGDRDEGPATVRETRAA